ncbi:hypothetical protein [Paraburkholderia caffeinilytica]|uniref:hypothetical protein n=1 Tax=Paraburkholderia caffeinilytica TaxID=1761016 RepID=UPI0038BC2C04
MTDKKIIEIPVETAQWDAFVTSFHNWQDELEKTNGAWSATDKGVKRLATSFDNVEDAFNDLVRAATDPKFSSPTSGTFVRIRKDTVETEKSWRNIAKEIERSSRGLTGIARSGLGGMLGLAGTAGALTSALYGATLGASNSVADDYKSSRQLGLQLGKEKEFGIAGEPYGLGRDQLEEAANAKQDVTKQQSFRNAGVTDFTQDAAELAWAKAKGEAALYSQWEKTSPQFAVTQAQAFFPGENPDQLRLLADAYNKGDLDKAHDLYEQNWEKTGYSQQQADQATQFKQDQAQKWAEIETAWNKDILLLAPHLDRWSSAATHLVTGFLDASAKTINDLADAGDNPTPPGTEPPPAAQNDYPARIARGFAIAGQWMQQHGLTNPFDGAGAGTVDQQGFTSDPDKAAHMAALEKATGMPKGFLQAQENIESSGGRNLANPNNPNHIGAFQFDAATAANYGVDRRNEYSNEVGAARYLADLKKKYGSWDKAVAAYDGFGGLDKDIAKYGDAWKEHISEFQKSGETEMYLRKLAWQGIDLNSSQPITPFNDSKAVKAAKDVDRLNVDPQIVPFDDVDKKAVDAEPQTQTQAQTDKAYVGEGLTDRLMRAAGMVSGWFGEGGGAALRTPDAPARTTNSTPQQFNIQMQVTAPAGTDVQVTGAQLAQ